MSSPFHPGEIAVQKRVGVSEQAREGKYRDAVPPAIAELLAQDPFSVLSSRDADGNIWASPLTGNAIFSVPDSHNIQIHVHRLDPKLDPALVDDVLAGLLVIDFDRRLRLRINGTLERRPGALNLRLAQFYGNCTKYIQRRVLSDGIFDRVPRVSPGLAYLGDFGSRLSDAHRTLISRSDTFFIATMHAESGADASHRGGRPGFVTIKDDRTLLWPDYRGNNMFNTIGNLEADPRAGLLFVDFDSGAALQLTGNATADFGDPSPFTSTGRSIRFDIIAVRELPPSSFLRYSLIEPFPYNPPLG